ncbi:hypothetical protein PCE1_000665 [Barthelona sp. PCE]
MDRDELLSSIRKAIRGDDTFREQLVEWSKDETDEFFESLGELYCDVELDADHRLEVGSAIALFFNAYPEDQTVIVNWGSLDEEQRTTFKENLFMTLGDDDKDIRNMTAVLVAKIGSMELPYEKWDSLIPDIVSVLNSDYDDVYKCTALDTLGYLCKDTPLQALINFDFDIAKVLAECMGEDYDMKIRERAVKALENSVKFLAEIFGDKEKAEILVQSVMQMFQESEKSAIISIRCMNQITTHYYLEILDLIQPVVENIMEILTCEIEDIIIQCLDFFTIIAKASDIHRIDPKLSILANSVEQLTRTLCEFLTQPDHTVDIDTWNLTASSSNCLIQLSNYYSTGVSDIALQYIDAYMEEDEWEKQYATIMIFGSIIAAIDESDAQTFASQFLDHVLTFFTDIDDDVSNELVLLQGTAAWCIGRITEHIPELVRGKFLPSIVNILLKAIQMPHNIACNIGYVIYALGDSFIPFANEETNALSPYLPDLIETLMERASAEDAKNVDVRGTCFMAIENLIKASAIDRRAYLAEDVLEKIYDTLKNLMGATEQDDIDIQAHMCVLIKATVYVLSDVLELDSANAILELMLEMLNNEDTALEVTDEVVAVLGPLATALEEDFVEHLDTVKDYILSGLRMVDSYDIIDHTTDSLSDIIDAVGPNIVPYVEEILTTIVESMDSEQAGNMVKIKLMSIFGDVAVAMQEDFAEYYAPSLKEIQGVMELEIDDDDEVYELKVALLEIASSFMQALRECPEVILDELEFYMDIIFNSVPIRDYFDEDIIVPDDNYETVSNIVVNTSVNVLESAFYSLQDVIATCGTEKPEEFSENDYISPWIKNIIRFSNNDHVRTVGRNTSRMYQRLLGALNLNR